jgi:hypothetical protein
VLALAEKYGPLAEVQHSVLVPLELELASRSEVDWWSPGQWVFAVRKALGAYSAARRRAELRARTMVTVAAASHVHDSAPISSSSG